MVAMAAKHHATPVVVLTGALNHAMQNCRHLSWLTGAYAGRCTASPGLYKLSPVYAYNQDTFNTLAAPGDTLDFSDGAHRCSPSRLWCFQSPYVGAERLAIERRAAI